MPNYKQVWVYSLGANSWTEVYYITANTLAAASVPPAALVSDRLQMLHSDGQLNKIRTSDVLNLRSTILVNYNRFGTYLGADGPDVTSTAAVVTLNSTAVPANRQVWLRGLPDSYVIRDITGAQDDPPPAFRLLITKWLLQLSNGGYQVRSLTKVAVPPVSPNIFGRILSINGTVGSGVSTITTDGVYSGVSSNRAIISLASAKQTPGLNGHWTVTPVAGDTYTIPYNMPSVGPILCPRARLRPEIYLYGAVSSSTSAFNFYRSRRTGKSFLGGRGRRTGVRLRSL